VGVVAALLVTVSACSAPEPVASNAVPPEAAPAAERTVFVTIGGSETLVRGPGSGLTESWTQQVYAALPLDAVHVNLASPAATVDEARATQLPRALALEPTLVAVWLGPDDVAAGTDASSFSAGLEALVTELRTAGADVLLLTAESPPGRNGDLVPGVEAVADATGATHVPVPVPPDADPPTPDVQRRIAEAVLAAL
jgi:hypothetical protein